LPIYSPQRRFVEETTSGVQAMLSLDAVSAVTDGPVLDNSAPESQSLSRVGLGFLGAHESQSLSC
jgi:hypothetical protein